MMAFGFPPVSVDDFFEANIIQNLANFFGIPMSSIRVVNVIREDTVLRRKRSAGGGATGVEIEITPDKADTNSTEAVKQATNTIVDAVSTGDATVLGEIMKDTPVAAVVSEIKITKLAPIPPSPETEPEAFEAWSNSITESIEEGKTEVSKPVPTVSDIGMNWTLPSRIDEEEVFADFPLIYFTDSDGVTLETVGNSADPWVVMAELVNGKVNQTLVNDKAWLTNGVASFKNMSIVEVDSATDIKIKFSVVYPEAAANMSLSVTSNWLTVYPLPEPTTTGAYVETTTVVVDTTTGAALNTTMAALNTTVAEVTTTVVLTAKPTTVKPTTVKPTTMAPTTKPTTTEQTTVASTTTVVLTAKPTTVKSTTVKSTTAEPTTAKPTNETTQPGKPCPIRSVLRDDHTIRPKIRRLLRHRKSQQQRTSQSFH
jgi:hypothetical protein